MNLKEHLLDDTTINRKIMSYCLFRNQNTLAWNIDKSLVACHCRKFNYLTDKICIDGLELTLILCYINLC